MMPTGTPNDVAIWTDFLFSPKPQQEWMDLNSTVLMCVFFVQLVNAVSADTEVADSTELQIQCGGGTAAYTRERHYKI